MHALLCTEPLIALLVAVDGIEGDHGVHTQRRLAVFWGHPLAVLLAAVNLPALNEQPVRERELTPHQGATKATTEVACEAFGQQVAHIHATFMVRGDNDGRVCVKARKRSNFRHSSWTCGIFASAAGLGEVGVWGSAREMGAEEDSCERRPIRGSGAR